MHSQQVNSAVIADLHHALGLYLEVLLLGEEYSLNKGLTIFLGIPFSMVYLRYSSWFNGSPHKQSTVQASLVFTIGMSTKLIFVAPIIQRTLMALLKTDSLWVPGMKAAQDLHLSSIHGKPFWYVVDPRYFAQADRCWRIDLAISLQHFWRAIGSFERYARMAAWSPALVVVSSPLMSHRANSKQREERFQNRDSQKRNDGQAQPGTIRSFCKECTYFLDMK